MKAGIHPEYTTTTVVCACGNQFETKSTEDGEIHVEICSVCHPFYTGKQRLVDTAGRVERFKRKYGDTSSEALKEAEEAREAEEAEKAAAKAEAEAERAEKEKAKQPEALAAQAEAEAEEAEPEAEADEPEASGDEEE